MTLPQGLDVQRLLTVEERGRLAELEEQVLVGGAAAVLAGRALTEIRDSSLYQGSHATFEAYVHDRFGFSRARAYQLMDYAAAAADFEERGLHLPPERITRALGGVVPDDYQLVLDVTKAVTGKERPSSADVQGVAETVRDLAAGAHIEHPDTHQKVPLAEVPPERRVEAVTKAVQLGAKDRRDFQGTDDVKPWDWLEDLRGVADVNVLGTAEGWHVELTDRSSGEVRTGPAKKTVWDAIRHARAAWEGDTNHEPEQN
ncbi:hypothetical protein [Deinococcus hohokamensis]|uniref:DUF222 domain-containing protein n=1 Tax=Deinococcus hohokamensis TaxID=309883 RepID=A0ABV9I5E2_9DEIO